LQSAEILQNGTVAASEPYSITFASCSKNTRSHKCVERFYSIWTRTEDVFITKLVSW